VDTEAAIGEIIREYRTPGTESYEKQLAETLRKAAERIQNGGYVQANGSPQDILGTLLAADEVYCEVPFCYKDETTENTVWNGIMDVIYSKDGRWHILDYKTSADGSGLDTRYQDQLSAYVRAFKATTGIDADAKTYHIDI
jgi:ATP-dependent exoDNAse (exonuclease V) beta subunit